IVRTAQLPLNVGSKMTDGKLARRALKHQRRFNYVLPFAPIYQSSVTHLASEVDSAMLETFGTVLIGIKARRCTRQNGERQHFTRITRVEIAIKIEPRRRYNAAPVRRVRHLIEVKLKNVSLGNACLPPACVETLKPFGP